MVAATAIASPEEVGRLLAPPARDRALCATGTDASKGVGAFPFLPRSVVTWSSTGSARRANGLVFGKTDDSRCRHD